MPRDLGELSRAALATRRVNVLVRQAARLAAWRLAPAAYQTPALAAGDFSHLLFARSIPIARGGQDVRFERGKRKNVALAVPHLDGLVVSPERPFSFWRAVPRPTAARGYQHGMELRGGCIVPSLGGGLCLLSNALFAAASQLGWRLLERHAHTMTADRHGDPLDATVLWPHVDLRFAPREGRARLRVRVRGGALHIAVWSDRPAALSVDIAPVAGLERMDGPILTTAIRRVVRAADGALLEDAFVALDRKRLLDPGEARRNCYTCDRPCGARPKDLP
jgi:vancomycin resistance protein VanW